nr:hypothetical protein [Tanacetum cinerariifolium]
RDNDIPAYTNRFQELALICTKFVSNETEKVDKSTCNTNATNNRGGNRLNPRGNCCFECGNPGHFKRDCPKLKNKDGEMGMLKDGCMLWVMQRGMEILWETRTQMSSRVCSS